MRKGQTQMKKAAVILILLALCGSASADTGWVFCKPGDYVNIRREPDRKSELAGFLDVLEEFQTEWETRDGFVRVYGVGDGEGWIYAGFVSAEKPEEVMETYVCTAKRRVACRRWIDGPRIAGKVGWLKNGGNVTVYYRTSEWSVTSRGYIRSEWLEADP